MKKNIRLSQSGLRNLVRESVKRALMETELTYDVDNFSGKHYKTEPNMGDYVDSEGYLDDPNDNPSSGNGWDDLVSDLGGDEKAAEEEYSWMLHDNQPVAPGVGGFYNVGQRGVEKDVDDAIMMNNRRLYGTNNRIGDLARKRWVNGRTPGDMEDWTDDMRYLHPEAFEESKLRGIVRESIKRVLRESAEDCAMVEDFIKQNNLYNGELEWVTDNYFCDEHGFNGYIFDSEEEAANSVLNGDNHQNAIDLVDGAQTDEEWVSYLINGGVDESTAQQIIANHDWNKVVEIIVQNAGAEWFLSTYSGRIYNLPNGKLLYY